MTHFFLKRDRANPHLQASVGQALVAWALEELGAWRFDKLNPDAALARMQAIHATSRTIYLYEFRGRSVTLHEKPDHVEQYPNGRRRAFAYLGLFQSACADFPDDFHTHILLDTWDKVVQPFDVPVFCFQKRRGENYVLLPDIDFLNHDFYQDPRFTDQTRYAEKLPQAIFVGSTSGGTITPDVARNCTVPRLRAARTFLGNPRVDFLLPQIVQTTNEEAVGILRQMAFCQTAHMGWPEQLRRRFVISMDGNGATCSRVAIALHSNSVLLKYQSDDLLYYFRHLQPWLHYVPVGRDSDVDAILDMEIEQPELFETISENSKRFAAEYLSRDAVMEYTSQLLLHYADCFSEDEGAENMGARTAPVAPTMHFPKYVTFFAHVQGRGDVAAGDDGWVGEARDHKNIEGFAFSLGNLHFNRQFAYHAIRADGTPEPAAQAGTFCGTRGRGLPIYGFMIDHTPDASDLPALIYEGVFRDGSKSGPMAPGSACKSATGAPLVAMRIGVATPSGQA